MIASKKLVFHLLHIFDDLDFLQNLTIYHLES